MSFRHKQDKEINMITEDYVSFEIAKLLKERGFDGPCYKVWESHGGSQTLVGASWFVEGETVVNKESVDAAAKQYAYEYNFNNNVEAYLAPTLQMVMKWLREKHLIFFDLFHINGDIEDGEEFQIGIYEKTSMDTYTWKNWIKGETYEKTYKKAIKYCLENLI